MKSSSSLEGDFLHEGNLKVSSMWVTGQRHGGSWYLKSSSEGDINGL